MQEDDHVTTTLQTIPARRGKAVRVNKGQSVKVINTHGNQVVDFWAFNAGDLREYLGMEHCRAFWTRLFPVEGDKMVTNRRRPILGRAKHAGTGQLHRAITKPVNAAVAQGELAGLRGVGHRGGSCERAAQISPTAAPAYRQRWQTG